MNAWILGAHGSQKLTPPSSAISIPKPAFVSDRPVGIKLNFWQISGLQSFEPQKEVSIIPPKSGKKLGQKLQFRPKFT